MNSSKYTSPNYQMIFVFYYKIGAIDWLETYMENWEQDTFNLSNQGF